MGLTGINHRETGSSVVSNNTALRSSSICTGSRVSKQYSHFICTLYHNEFRRSRWLKRKREVGWLNSINKSSLVFQVQKPTQLHQTRLQSSPTTLQANATCPLRLFSYWKRTRGTAFRRQSSGSRQNRPPIQFFVLSLCPDNAFRSIPALNGMQYSERLWVTRALKSVFINDSQLC